MIPFKIQMYECMNVNIRISRFEISRYFVKCVFLTMGSSDGEGLSQLYLELVDAYKKRFMPQNGQTAVLKCSPMWKNMRKSFKKLSELSSSPKLRNGKLWPTRHPLRVVR